MLTIQYSYRLELLTMTEKLEERNQNFLRHSLESHQKDNTKFVISLRKGKRLSYILSKRSNFVNEETLSNSSNIFNTNNTTTNDFQNINNLFYPSDNSLLIKIKSSKTIIQNYSNPTELNESLKFIKEIISKNPQKFPFIDYFDDQIITIYKSLLTQNENKFAASKVLQTLINTFAHSEQIGNKFIESGIIEILINISKLVNDVKMKTRAVNAIGNVHNMKQEITNYFSMIKYWNDLLDFVALNDKDLTVMSIWCLSFFYKTSFGPGNDISNLIMTRLQTLFDSKDIPVLKEFLWLLHYLTRNDSYTVHLFFHRNYHLFIQRLIGIPNLDILNPSYKIITNLIKHSKSYTIVLIDLGFATRISVSFKNKNSAYQKLSLSTYSLMLTRATQIALKLIKGKTFKKFIKQINSNPASNLTVLKAIHDLIVFKDAEINQLLFQFDVLMLLVSASTLALDRGNVFILKSLIEWFEFYSQDKNEDFNTMLMQFRNINGEVLVNNLYMSKVDDVHNDAEVFIKTFLE